MKTLKKIIAIAILPTALFVSSCKQTQTIPLSITGDNTLRLSSASLSGVKGELVVNVKNENPYDIKILKSDLEIRANDILIGKARFKRHLVIPANSEVEEIVYLKTKFNKVGYFDIPKLVKTVKSKTVKIVIKGNLQSGHLASKTVHQVKIVDSVNVLEKAKPAIDFANKVGKKSMALLSKLKRDKKEEN